MNHFRKKEAELNKKITDNEALQKKLEQKISLVKDIFYNSPFVLPGVDELQQDAEDRNNLRR